jgi:inosine-uridine nucleoside N-ribohydrolase
MDRETMVNNAVVVWLGGHSKDWVDTKEFNMKQDIAAARVVMLSGCAFVQLPCSGVVKELRTTEWELKYWLDGQNDLGTYLYNNTRNAVKHRWHMAWSRVIWDISAVAWLLNDNNRMMQSYLIPAPIPEYDGKYSFDPRNHPIRYVYNVSRDDIFTDLFTKIRNYKA